MNEPNKIVEFDAHVLYAAEEALLHEGYHLVCACFHFVHDVAQIGIVRTVRFVRGYDAHIRSEPDNVSSESSLSPAQPLPPPRLAC